MTTGLILYARLKSRRLARKVLKPINGRPMIGHLMDRLRQSAHAKHLTLCTSTVAEDDDLAHFSEANGVTVFRGSADDVLVRLRDAAVRFGFSDFLCVTGDNPFADPAHLDALAETARADRADYATTADLPLGVTGYYLRTNAVKRACAIKDTSDTEFWPEYFTQTSVFRVATARPLTASFARPDLRLTVDYLEDFSLAETLINKLGGAPTLHKVIAYLDAHPDLRACNAQAVQAARPSPTLKPRHSWDPLMDRFAAPTA